jgi:hypothetical protein
MMHNAINGSPKGKKDAKCGVFCLVDKVNEHAMKKHSLLGSGLW